jgi:hypothetical protein
VELELLKAAARQRLAAGQGELDLGLDTSAPGGPLPITASRMGCLVDALDRAWRVLVFAEASGGDEVFRQLVIARIIEPVSKLDSARVLEEAGVPPVPYRTVTRRLRVFARDSWRQQICAACAAHAGLGPAWSRSGAARTPARRSPTYRDAQKVGDVGNSDGGRGFEASDRRSGDPEVGGDFGGGPAPNHMRCPAGVSTPRRGVISGPTGHVPDVWPAVFTPSG